jgi:tRNA1(Val) A37 N6-methylase TrmN6
LFAFCERYRDLSAKRCVEVGWGIGYASIAAAQRSAATYPIDVVDQALAFAARRLR